MNNSNKGASSFKLGPETNRILSEHAKRLEMTKTEFMRKLIRDYDERSKNK